MAFSEPKGSRQYAEELSAALRNVSAEITHLDCFDQFPIELEQDLLVKQLEMGRPIFVPQQVKINQAVAEKTFALTLEKFKNHLDDIAQDWNRLDQAFQSGDFSPAQLLEITLLHQWAQLKNLSLKLAVDSELLQFFSLYLARPYRQKIAERFWSVDKTEFWKKSYCPVCGHHPSLSRLFDEPSRRQLWCCCCNTNWDFTRIGCHYCANNNQKQLGYLTVEEFPDFRIYVCDLCRRYLKTGISQDDQNRRPWDYDLEYFASASLDQAALAQGYISESIWINRNDQPGDGKREICSESK